MSTYHRSRRRRAAGAAVAMAVALAGLVAPVGPASAVDAGVIVTLIGGRSSTGSTTTSPRLAAPRTAAVDNQGVIYFTDTDNNMIRRLDTSGVVTTVAGTGAAGYSGDGGPATAAQIWRPHGVAVDNRGHVFIADSPNHRIRRVDLTSGIITTVAGTGTSGYSGDGGPATQAKLDRPRFLIVDPDGSLIIADTGNRVVRRVSPGGMISTVAGTGDPGQEGDGGPATAAHFDDPRGLARDAAGNLYVVDTEGVTPNVRMINRSGIISRVAGGGPAGYGGDGGPALSARLHEPRSIAISGSNLYIADSLNNRIRRVDLSSGTIDTVVGTGVGGYGGDGGAATAARVAEPRGVAVTPTGDVIVVDTNNNRIRLVGAPDGGTPPPQPATAQVQGTVVDAAGRPAHRGVIEVADASGFVTSTSAAAGGDFALGLDDGDYVLRARDSIGCDPLRSGPSGVAVRNGASDPASVHLSLLDRDRAGVDLEPATAQVEQNGGSPEAVLETSAGEVHLAFEGATAGGPGVSPEVNRGTVTAACRPALEAAGSYLPLDTGLDFSSRDLRYSAVTVCLPYTDAQAARFDEARLSLVRLPDGEPLSAVSVDVRANLVCGRTSSFSGLAVAGPRPVDPPPVPAPGPGPGPGSYRLSAADGGIFAFGEAGFFGSTGSMRLNRPIVGMSSTASGDGYWLVAADGGIFAFGDARFFGSTGSIRLNQPIVGMAPTSTGRGYWLVAADGGIFAFGDARFFGSTGSIRLNQPVTGMAARPQGDGYWLLARDGGIFAFGVPFLGSGAGGALIRPAIGMAVTSTGAGYWIASADGRVLAFGDARFLGSVSGVPLNQPIVTIAAAF